MILWKYWWKAQSWPEAYLFRVSNGEYSNLISNFSKFKKPGQKPFTYS